MKTANNLENSYTRVVLLTLGAQLAETKIKLKNRRLYLSNFIRLILAPIIGFINVVLSSIELNNEPELLSKHYLA